MSAMRFQRLAAWMFATLGVIAFIDKPSIAQAFDEERDERKGDDPRPPGFAYDPEKEEGPHPGSDFEWWYHFGFLKEKGSPEFGYSFVSSLQRNKAGRYQFCNLSDLRTGKNHHYAVVDKPLLAGLSFLLPEGHVFMAPPAPPTEPPKSELWFRYGDNRLEKEAASYRAFYQNRGFALDLTLRRQGPPMPVLGTGLTGLDKPEDQHYYTFPRLSAVGHLRKDGRETGVEGNFWYDHQWGKVTTGTLMKWCWWGLRLDNGQNLSIFFLQNARTGKMVQKGLTLHHPDGKTEVCRKVTFAPKRSWKSSRGRTYFVQWEIKTPTLGLAIQTQTITDDHEIPVLLYKQIWEGPCRVDVAYADGRNAKGIGFQEMIGQGND
jgi:predicted secreted hydrolase